MSRESYFAQYVSPNIVIVPTLSFKPPSKENKIDTNTGCCEQYSVNNTSKTSTPSSKSDQNITIEADCNIADTGTLELDNSEQDIPQTEEQENKMNQSIKDLASNKYKSQNNLVDLTGFNIQKRDSSITRLKDSDRKQFNTDKNIIKSMDKIENEEHLGSDTRFFVNNNKTYRESSSSGGVSNSSDRKENIKEITSNGSKEDKTDIEDKMKKYFRQLWKRNIDKLKDRAKQNKDSKSLRTKQICKDTQQEPSQNKSSKSKLEATAKQTTTKSSKTKTTSTSKYSGRAKSESKSSLQSIRDREGGLSPDSIIRYKNFQRYLRHNDDDKYKTEKQKKKENSHESTKLLKPNKTPICHAVPKKSIERKISVKSDLHGNKNLDNVDTMRLVKSVVTQVNKNLPNNYTQSKCDLDLRSRLSRKRTRSECFTHSQQILENKLDKEDLIITVKQDVKPDPKILDPMLQPKNKPKTKKSKRIKLVINIECPTSDSEDSDQNLNDCCASPQDLSFLDDFDVDEIVDLLNTSNNQADASATSSEISHQINNTIENDQMIKNNRENKSKGRLIKATNIKNSKTNKVKNNNNDKSAGDKNHGRDDKESKTNSSLLKNKRSNGGEANIRKKNDKKITGSVTETKKPLKIVNETTNKKVDKVTKDIKLLTESNVKSNKNSKKLSRNPEGRIQKPRSTTKNVPNMKAAKSVKPSHINTKKVDDSIEASLETMFNDIKQNTSSETNEIQFNISKKQVNETQITKIEDTIEASLHHMFNNNENETAFNIVKNTSKHIKQEEIIPTTQQITQLLVEPHDQKVKNQLKMTMINDIDTHIKIETEKLQSFEAQILSDTTKNSIEEKVNSKRNSEQQKNSNKDVQQRIDHLQNSKDTKEKSIEIPINIRKKSANNEMHTKPETKRLEKLPQTAKNTSAKSLEDVKDTKTKEQVNVTSPRKPDKNSKENDSNKSKDTIKKPLEKTSINLVNKAKHTSSISSLQPSDKNTKQKYLLNTEQISKQCCVTENNISENKGDNKIDNGALTKEKEKQDSNETINNKATTNNAENFNVKTNMEPLNVTKHIIEAEHMKETNHTIKSSVAEPNNNLTEKKVEIEMDVGNKSINEKAEHMQKSTKTLIKVQEIPINNKLPNNCENNIHEKTEKQLKTCENKCHEAKTETNVEKENHIQMDFESSNISDKNVKEKSEPLIISTNTVKEQFSATIDIKTSNKPDINIKENEKLLQNLTDISKNSKEVSINNIKEKSNIKTGIKKSNESNKTISENLKREDTSLEAMNKNEGKTTSIISNKKIETTVNNVQQTECSSEKSLKTVNDTNKNAGTETFSEKSAPITKNSMLTVDIKKDSNACKKELIKAAAKPNTEEKLEKSSVKANDCPKPRTIDETKAKDTEIQKNTVTNNTSNKLDGKLETNTKIKQKQMESEKIISNGADKKQETKNKVPSEVDPFVKKIEERMLIYLDKQYTVTSLVHTGRFSLIYKCKDAKGDNYAVKVMNSTQLKNKGICMERMLSQLQIYRSIRNSSILGFINGFGVQGLWCLLTEYYPKNLEEALKENKRSFHIELVQILARQLIDAVNMLTNHNIIHSDIKPAHILLNSDNDRLKLCGFERSNYIDRMHITPSSGTPSYRAPEIILGFSENFKIDVWSTALVIFEMATNIKLFPGQYNNDILYKQICTLGSFDWEMMENCRYKHKHFKGLTFVRRVGFKGENIVLINAFHRNKRLRKELYKSAQSLTKWGAVESKLEKLHTLLEQMLVLDPRHRLPIQFAGLSEFIQDVFT